MKTNAIQLFLLALLLLIGTYSRATFAHSEWQGDWTGNLQLPGGKELPLVFHIKADGTRWTVTMDSPQQGGFGIPVKAELKDKSVSFKVEQLEGCPYIIFTTAYSE